jgi:hypothetical protein
MPRRSSISLGALAFAPVLGCVTGARAPQATVVTPAAAPAPTALAGEMAPLGFYVGRWACKGTELDAAGKAVKAYDLTVDVTPKLDGSWLEIVVLDGATPVTHELKGYDARDHKFHHLWAVPGQWGSLTSDGWEGDHMTFVDDKPAAGAAAERMVFTKDSDVHYRHRAEALAADGTWHATFTKDCAKHA